MFMKEKEKCEISFIVCESELRKYVKVKNAT